MNKRRSQQGVTLIELMVVVVIVGVLSAIAIPSFQSYLYKSRTTEAIGFLGTIKLRQEAFRAEFGQYCNIPAFHPGAIPGTTPVAWDPAPGGPVANPELCNWDALGARPDAFVRFQYNTTAGAPATAPAALGWTAATADFWFVSQAQGDLNGDGVPVLFESYSASSRIWCDQDKGWE